MIEVLNSLVGKKYDSDNYHCYHFIEEVLSNAPKLKNIHVDTALGDIEKYRHLFYAISSPEDYCIVLLGAQHIGIYFQKGVFHNNQVSGVHYTDMRTAKLTYNKISYYKIKDK